MWKRCARYFSWENSFVTFILGHNMLCEVYIFFTIYRSPLKSGFVCKGQVSTDIRHMGLSNKRGWRGELHHFWWKMLCRSAQKFIISTGNSKFCVRMRVAPPPRVFIILLFFSRSEESCQVIFSAPLFLTPPSYNFVLDITNTILGGINTTLKANCFQDINVALWNIFIPIF